MYVYIVCVVFVCERVCVFTCFMCVLLCVYVYICVLCMCHVCARDMYNLKHVFFTLRSWFDIEKYIVGIFCFLLLEYP